MNHDANQTRAYLCTGKYFPNRLWERVINWQRLFITGHRKKYCAEKASFQPSYLASSGNDNQFFLSDSKPPNVSFIGSVSFENNKLSLIQRNWGSYSGKTESVEITKTLFSAIENAKVASGTAVIVSTSVQRIPGAEFKSIHFDFPGRRISIMSADSSDSAKYADQVSIDESLSNSR